MLSPRQWQVLSLLVDGCSGKEMAHELGLSRRTIEIHRSKLLGKLGVRSSLEAVGIGALAGLGSCQYLSYVRRG